MTYKQREDYKELEVAYYSLSSEYDRECNKNAYLLKVITSIALEYIELSQDKAMNQRNDIITRARNAIDTLKGM